MNPWYENLVARCYREHDHECEQGKDCQNLRGHVEHHYVPSALRRRVDQAEAERNEWRQTAEDEHAAALDLIEVVKERDQRIKTLVWRNGHLIDKCCADMADLVARADQAEARIEAVRDVLDAGDKDERWWVQEWGHRAVMTADIRRALDGDTL